MSNQNINTPHKMKKIISEIRKAFTIIFLDHAMTWCPKGEFKKALAEFIVANHHKLNDPGDIRVDVAKGHDERVITATLSGRIGTGKTVDEAIENLYNQINQL